MVKAALSDRLFMIGGLFEKYRGTGGSFSAEEARFLAAQMNACAELARAMAIEAGHANEMLDLIVEEARAAARPSPRPSPEVPEWTGGRVTLRVIEGGLSEIGGET